MTSSPSLGVPVLPLEKPDCSLQSCVDNYMLNKLKKKNCTHYHNIGFAGLDGRWKKALHLLRFVVDTGNAILLMKIFQRLHSL